MCLQPKFELYVFWKKLGFFGIFHIKLFLKCYWAFSQKQFSNKLVLNQYSTPPQFSHMYGDRAYCMKFSKITLSLFSWSSSGNWANFRTGPVYATGCSGLWHNQPSGSTAKNLAGTNHCLHKNHPNQGATATHQVPGQRSGAKYERADCGGWKAQSVQPGEKSFFDCHSLHSFKLKIPGFVWRQTGWGEDFQLDHKEYWRIHRVFYESCLSKNCKTMKITNNLFEREKHLFCLWNVF